MFDQSEFRTAKLCILIGQKYKKLESRRAGKLEMASTYGILARANCIGSKPLLLLTSIFLVHTVGSKQLQLPWSSTGISESPLGDLRLYDSESFRGFRDYCGNLHIGMHDDQRAQKFVNLR